MRQPIINFIVAFAVIGSIQCARHARPFSIKDFLEPKIHPNAATATQQCHEGVRSALKAGELNLHQSVIAACRSLYIENHCRDALTLSLDTTPGDRASLIANACAEAYCPILTEPKPVYCLALNARPPRTEGNRQVGDLHLAILTHDIGVSSALKVMSAYEDLAEKGTKDQPLFWADTSELLSEFESEGSGGLDKDLIGKQMTERSKDVKACYEHELVGNPDLAIGLSVRFVIGPEGKVINSRVIAATRAHALLEKCVLSIIDSVEFPAPQGGSFVRVTKPYVFVTEAD